MLSKFVLPGILFLLTLAFGFWVSRLGKPYNGLLFNVHKLIALGGVVALVIQLTRIFKLASPQTLVVVLLALAALAVITLFASGALMSAGKLSYRLMLTLHQIAPVVLVIAGGLVLYLI